MAYTINTTSGSTLATVADGTVNTTSASLTLIGKNYAGYGQFLNENFVKLLENFSNSSAPNAPISGQLWYDNSAKVLKVYSNSQWKSVSSSTSGTSQPTNPVVGDVWWDTANSQLNVYSGSAWVVIGPAFTASAGTSGAVVETITDTVASSHVVVKLYVSNTVIGVVSKDALFTPQTAIAGFTTVIPGINLISPSTLAGAQFTGDVSNAKLLNGNAASAFLRSDQNTSTTYKITAGGGLLVGSDLDLTTSPTSVQLTNLKQDSDFNFHINKGGTSTKAIGITASTNTVSIPGPFIASAAASVGGTLTVTGAATHQGLTTATGGVVPATDIGADLGTAPLRFNDVYAVTFRGTAITAQYADLAERFEADAEYAPGTVVSLGGTKEITSSAIDAGDDVFGVVSTSPAYLMNETAGTNATHPAIALSGRVPVNVSGTVNKGDRLISAGNGTARAALAGEATSFNVIGRALADKTTSAPALIEVIVKVNN